MPLLGPTLWNIMYDGVLTLRILLVGYADDLTLVVFAKAENLLMV